MGVVGAVRRPGAHEDIAHLSLGHGFDTPAWSEVQSRRQHRLWLNSAVAIIQ